jgi:hypothetical protein
MSGWRGMTIDVEDSIILEIESASEVSFVGPKNWSAADGRRSLILRLARLSSLLRCCPCRMLQLVWVAFPIWQLGTRVMFLIALRELGSWFILWTLASEQHIP